MEFKGKTVLITGSAVGIGKATAITFAKKGANVVLADINKEKLDDVKQIAEKYTQVLAFICDVSDEESVNNTVAEAEKVFGKIDILVNNAALWRSYKPFVETDTREWKTFFDINVMGTVYFAKAVLPKMLENGYGRIINIASVAGVYGNANMVNYSATKGAVISMTKALAKEVAKSGVTVNSVSPGSVSPAENPDTDYTEDSELSFMGRTGSANENANLICFLASNEAGYISGQNVQIDGCRKRM